MCASERMRHLFDFSAEEANRRIDDWFRRGYVMFSDVSTKSTHLRPVGEKAKGG